MTIVAQRHRELFTGHLVVEDGQDGRNSRYGDGSYTLLPNYLPDWRPVLR